MHANPSYTLKEEKDQQSQCFKIWEYTQKYAEWEFLFFCFFKSGTSCRVGFSPHILEPVFSALIFRFTVGQLIILKISSCCPCLVGCAYVTVECSKWVELQTSSVAQSLFLILSYSRKSDLVVSEVQMILVSHSLWNLSFYHDTPLPPPPEPSILLPISFYPPCHLCNSTYFLLQSVASLCCFIIFSPPTCLIILCTFFLFSLSVYPSLHSSSESFNTPRP